MTTPTNTLRHEHDVILRVLQSAEREFKYYEDTGQLQVGQVEQMLDFFRNFADGCHHRKEEQQLFIRMQERGIPMQGGPIGVMLTEHELGRHHLGQIAAALLPAQRGESAAMHTIAEHLRDYVSLLRSHIMKENNILFPMADRVLTAQDQTELSAAFERIEQEEAGIGAHEKYHQLAHELSSC